MRESHFNPEQDEDPSRRKFLKIAAGALGLSTLSQVGDRVRPTPEEEETEPEEEEETAVVPELPELPAQPKTYAVSQHLQGRNMADLYAFYTGHKGPMPRTLAVDFDKNLQILWAKKKLQSKK